MKAYSQDLRERVILTFKQGRHSRASLSRMFHVCYDTVCDWINRYEMNGDYSSKQGVGCGRKQRFNDKESILQFIEKNPDADGIEIRDAVAPELPMSTFYDTLKRLNITYKKRAKIQTKKRVTTV
jgi:isfu1 transposase